MKLVINGKTIDTPQLDTVAALVRWLDVPTFGTAIELNGAVVRKSDFEHTPLRNEDLLEIVKLVGGG